MGQMDQGSGGVVMKEEAYGESAVNGEEACDGARVGLDHVGGVESGA